MEQKISAMVSLCLLWVTANMGAMQSVAVRAVRAMPRMVTAVQPVVRMRSFTGFPWEATEAGLRAMIAEHQNALKLYANMRHLPFNAKHEHFLKAAEDNAHQQIKHCNNQLEVLRKARYKIEPL